MFRFWLYGGFYMSSLRLPYLIAVTALVLIAFAGNSVLNRLALVEGLIDPVSFVGLRVVSGAGLLVALLLWRGARQAGLRGGLRAQWQWPHGTSVGGLAVYMLSLIHI